MEPPFFCLSGQAFSVLHSENLTSTRTIESDFEREAPSCWRNRRMETVRERRVVRGGTLHAQWIHRVGWSLDACRPMEPSSAPRQTCLTPCRIRFSCTPAAARRSDFSVVRAVGEPLRGSPKHGSLDARRVGNGSMRHLRKRAHKDEKRHESRSFVPFLVCR
jgi:hypothetical protein